MTPGRKFAVTVTGPRVSVRAGQRDRDVRRLSLTVGPIVIRLGEPETDGPSHGIGVS